MKREDLLAYLNRGWDELERLRDEAWARERRSEGPSAAFGVAAELRRWARALRPDGPDEDARAADLEHHVQLGALLRRVRPGPR